ncbi:MAG: CopD family protein [Steroidobacteraceae bacterium]
MDISGWEVAAAIVKAASYAATLGAAGGVFFLAYCGPLLCDTDRLKTRRFIGRLILVSVCTSMLRIPMIAGSMSGDIPGAFDLALNRFVWLSAEGRATSIRIAGLIAIVPIAYFNRRIGVIAILGAAIAATSFAWIGHAHALHPGALAELLIGVHLLGVAFWIGALAPLLLVSRNPDPLRFARVARRFGQAAVSVVMLLMAAGAALLCMLLGSIPELWTSPYGRAISLKIGIVGCLLSAAAVNKLRLTPRLGAGDGVAATSLRRSIRLEITLVCAILLTTGALTTMWSPAGH